MIEEDEVVEEIERDYPDEDEVQCSLCDCADPSDPGFTDTGNQYEGVGQTYCNCSCHGGSDPEDGEPW